jgi:hypothetical protein
MPLLICAPANNCALKFVISVHTCVEIEHLRAIRARAFNHLCMEAGVRAVYGTIEEIKELRFTIVRS